MEGSRYESPQSEASGQPTAWRRQVVFWGAMALAAILIAYLVVGATVAYESWRVNGSLEQRLPPPRGQFAPSP